MWSSNRDHRPLTITASVCYDATDLALAADLRSRSDLYIICALNRDVGTFDRMSEALHYHMYQGVLLVNNGQFGGSSFFMPLRNHFTDRSFISMASPRSRSRLQKSAQRNWSTDQGPTPSREGCLP